MIACVVTSCTTEKPAPSTDASAAKATKESVPLAAHLRCQVLTTLPHDTMAFTQGLQVVNGMFVESTGQYGTSSIRHVNIKTGKVLKRTDLGPRFFGEGVTVLQGKAYMLTWLNQQGFVYDASTLQEIGTFRYSGEGWGLTNDGTYLIMSNGSNTLTFLDPVNARVVKSIDVMLDGAPLRELNELEYINGEIWANVWRQDVIARIDPATGIVRSVVDCTGLLPLTEHTPSTDVLNGIAFDSVSKKIYVTGKNWPHIYEITTSP
ncbi:MAG: glutaminyl-peptide cyclotransferase [Bacteroidetes bacterium]|nr:glutaminyl-peptide cyclotransferase [Bacteroidota bacterium]